MNNSVLSQIQGTWILESMSFKDQEGKDVDLYGKNPIGIAMFDASGYMNAQMGASNRVFFNGDAPAQGTSEEITSAFNSYMAFFGKYVEKSTGKLSIKLTGCLFPNWQAKEMIRYAEIKKNKLYLSTPPILMGDHEIAVQALWNKAL